MGSVGKNAGVGQRCPPRTWPCAAVSPRVRGAGSQWLRDAGRLCCPSHVNGAGTAPACPATAGGSRGKPLSGTAAGDPGRSASDPHVLTEPDRKTPPLAPLLSQPSLEGRWWQESPKARTVPPGHDWLTCREGAKGRGQGLVSENIWGPQNGGTRELPWPRSSPTTCHPSKFVK